MRFHFLKTSVCPCLNAHRQDSFATHRNAKYNVIQMINLLGIDEVRDVHFENGCRVARVVGLTLQARRLLLALREDGDWMSVDELAEALHNTKFRHDHLNLLDSMAVNGFIEIK